MVNIAFSFSWENFLQLKIEQVMLHYVTFGVLMYGVKRFQMKFTALEDLNLIPEYYDSEFLMGIVNSSR